MDAIERQLRFEDEPFAGTFIVRIRTGVDQRGSTVRRRRRWMGLQEQLLDKG